MRSAGAAFAVCVALLLGACTSLAPPSPAADAALPPGFPLDDYRQAAAQGKPVFRVDPAASLAVIEVGRSGSLARLGHEHVVASRDVGGYVLPGDGRADLFVPLAKLSVDEPALRAESGFETQLSQTDIAGTRSNMLASVLEADRFPFALIRVTGADVTRGWINAAITLHGETRTFEVLVQIEQGRDQLVVSGRFSFDQTAFGITPYSLLGGAIAVRDRVDLRFRIQAFRLGSGL